jgi:hypothetical protein
MKPQVACLPSPACGAERGKSEARLRPLQRPELCEGLGRRAGAGGEGMSGNANIAYFPLSLTLSLAAAPKGARGSSVPDQEIAA